jgi:hypothetical protein
MTRNQFRTLNWICLTMLKYLQEVKVLAAMAKKSCNTSKLFKSLTVYLGLLIENRIHQVVNSDQIQSKRQESHLVEVNTA